MIVRETIIRELKSLYHLIAMNREIVSDRVRYEAMEGLENAVTLLEQQVPRLLTAKDFRRHDAGYGGEIPCWKEAKSPTRRSGWAVICYGKWLADKDVARYWTGKPTEAIMEATPWT